MWFYSLSVWLFYQNIIILRWIIMLKYQTVIARWHCGMHYVDDSLTDKTLIKIASARYEETCKNHTILDANGTNSRPVWQPHFTIMYCFHTCEYDCCYHAIFAKHGPMWMRKYWKIKQRYGIFQSWNVIYYVYTLCVVHPHMETDPKSAFCKCIEVVGRTEKHTQIIYRMLNAPWFRWSWTKASVQTNMCAYFLTLCHASIFVHTTVQRIMHISSYDACMWYDCYYHDSLYIIVVFARESTNIHFLPDVATSRCSHFTNTRFKLSAWQWDIRSDVLVCSQIYMKYLDIFIIDILYLNVWIYI